jgi:hypothetical protein
MAAQTPSNSCRFLGHLLPKAMLSSPKASRFPIIWSLDRSFLQPSPDTDHAPASASVEPSTGPSTPRDTANGEEVYRELL